MGASSTPSLLLPFLGALAHILHGKSPGGAAAAAIEALGKVVA